MRPQFAFRGDRFRYITFYGLWNADELYNIQEDPGETRSLIADPRHQSTAREMENRLYAMLSQEGGMEIPMNKPRGSSQSKRWRERGDKKHRTFQSRL